MNVLDRLGPPTLSVEEDLLLRSLDAVIAGVIAPNAEETDRSGSFPWENIRALNELDMNLTYLPAQVGGSPISYAAYLECVRRISAACASTGIIWATGFHACKPIVDFGSRQQIERLLAPIATGGLASLCITEPDAGSDTTAMRLEMRPSGDEVVLTGTKTFITNGDVADLLLVFGRWSTIDAPRESLTCIAVPGPSEALAVGGLIDKMGIRGSSTATLHFDRCRVPLANVIGGVGRGLEVLRSSLNKSRPSVAAHALGIAEAALREAITYVNQRQQFGQHIIDFQSVQFGLADLVSDLATTAHWMWHVANLVDTGVEDIAMDASILKMRASDVAMRIATDAVQLHGGYGYCRGCTVERLMRDAKITQIWEGTNQIHRQLIGRALIDRSNRG